MTRLAVLLGTFLSGATLAQGEGAGSRDRTRSDAAAVRTDDAADLHGLEIGIRAGYGLPLGSTAGTLGGGSASFSDTVKGMFPLWADVGWRLNPNWYIGGFFQYGFGSVGAAFTVCSQTGVSCSWNDMRAGLNVHYHFLPDGPVDPWLGLGAGYEWLSAGGNLSGTFHGFEFGNAQLGADYKVSPYFGVGPFVAFTVAQFTRVSDSGTSGDIADKKIHDWLIFGLRGVFDFAL